ncbi:hypothetical protein [Mycetocola zhujimingii]|uniref:Uncharacterized protein n=1 Tax=Mycetocola zhujimingii TaxID=2079792 RepID=A0A2U1TC24_9MICO|nr:hypothetical protein [Mycetocola zhujimingii]PWC06441.1 hypothetical protein DF223_12685 [Mycetocola zhujimingii]
MVERTDALLRSLSEDLSLPEADRDTGAADGALRSVIRLLQEADALLADGHTDAAQRALDEAAYQVSDSWSFRSVLGAEVLRVAQGRGARKSP